MWKKNVIVRSNCEYDYFGNVLEYEYDYFALCVSTITQKVLVYEYFMSTFVQLSSHSVVSICSS